MDKSGKLSKQPAVNRLQATIIVENCTSQLRDKDFGKQLVYTSASYENFNDPNLVLSQSFCSDSNISIPMKTETCLTILHINLQSLRNKTEVFELLIHNYACHIICINEHWLNDDELAYYIPINFRLLTSFCRKKYKNGGVAVLVEKSVDFEINPLDIAEYTIEKEFENCGIILPKLKIIVLCVYRLPNITVTKSLEQWEKLLLYLHKFQKYKIVFIGDINVDVSKNNNESVDLNNFFMSYGYNIINDLPTRLNACLDNVITNITDSNLICAVTPYEVSDHRALILGITCSGKQLRSDEQYIYIRNYKRKNLLMLRNRINTKTMMDIIVSSESADKAWYKFTDTISQVLNNTCPIISLNSSRQDKCPWFNDKLKELRNKVHILYVGFKNGKNITAYKVAKRKYRKTLKEVKCDFIASKIFNSTNKTKTVWSIINDTKNTKIYNDGSSKITPNQFNECFIRKIKKRCSPDNNLLNKHKMVYHPSGTKKLLTQWSGVTSIEIIKVIRSLSNSKSEDNFGISNFVIKVIIDLIIEPLLYLINWSLSEGRFPDCLKCAVVVPIYKKKGGLMTLLITDLYLLCQFFLKYLNILLGNS